MEKPSAILPLLICLGTLAVGLVVFVAVASYEEKEDTKKFVRGMSNLTREAGARLERGEDMGAISSAMGRETERLVEGAPRSPIAKLAAALRRATRAWSKREAAFEA